MIGLFGEHQCTKGWDRRCREATSDTCTCDCGGHNHGTLVKKAVEHGRIIMLSSEVVDLAKQGRNIYHKRYGKLIPAEQIADMKTRDVVGMIRMKWLYLQD